MNDQARFESLEIKLMHLEDALAALSDANIRAQRELTQLRERVRLFGERLTGYENPQSADATAHEPPPHY